MLIYIASDHRGFALKEELKKFLGGLAYEVVDFGNKQFVDGDDYVDFGGELVKTLSRDPAMARGILLCGSGVGMCIVANKFRNIRAALCFSPDHAMAARNDDDANVLVLPADFIDQETARRIVAVWLQTPFSRDPRHARRLKKIEDVEKRTTNVL